MSDFRTATPSQHALWCPVCSDLLDVAIAESDVMDEDLYAAVLAEIYAYLEETL